MIEDQNMITTLNEERIKDLIHLEYQHYFRPNRMDRPIDIHATKLFNTDFMVNDLKTKLKIEID